MTTPIESVTTGPASAFAESGVPEEYGLALSGGGVRALLFHYGALLRINELGHLREIDRISSVSGGSWAAGFLACVWKRLEWDGTGRATNLEGLLGPMVMRLASLPLDVPIVALGIIPGVSPANILARILDRVFFRGMTLQDLPAPGEGPRFVFNTTDLATGTDFRMSRPYMGSYRLGLVRNPTTKVATAAAASAAFPPLISPLVLRLDPDQFEDVPGADLHDRRDLQAKVALVDGGAYDNLALEPITGRCRVLLVSDAGGNLGIAPPSWKWGLWSLQVIRVLEVAVSQAAALRRSTLSDDPTNAPFALWRTRTDPRKLANVVDQAFPVHEGWPEYMATLPTRLWPLPVHDRHRLVDWGYLTSDLALRAFVWKDAAPPTALPYPAAGFEQAPVKKPEVAGERI